MTRISKYFDSYLYRLELRKLSILHAVIAKIMHWLPVFHSRLQRVRKHSRFELVQNIAQSLSFKVVMLSENLLQIGYPIGERLLLLMAKKNHFIR